MPFLRNFEKNQAITILDYSKMKLPSSLCQFELEIKINKNVWVFPKKRGNIFIPRDVRRDWDAQYINIYLTSPGCQVLYIYTYKSYDTLNLGSKKRDRFQFKPLNNSKSVSSSFISRKKLILTCIVLFAHLSLEKIPIDSVLADSKKIYKVLFCKDETKY